MTPEQQRIAIAQACGYKDLETKWSNYHQWECPDGRIRFGTLNDKYACLPDYLNDLNAMHEAESALTEKHIRSYAFTLAQVLDTSPTVDLDDQFLNIHATAAQRAEAFLRTLNLWTP